jgi:AcrR family transcriptional regulator
MSGASSHQGILSMTELKPAEHEAPARRIFSKKPPNVRQLELIEATCRCLSRVGATETSVRTIAEEAGLSLGMVRHHFNSKDELLAATLQHLSNLYQLDLRRALAVAPQDPEGQLRAFIDASLAPEMQDPEYVKLRFLFWELARTNPVVRRVHDRIYTRFRRQLRLVLSNVANLRNPQADTQLLTVLIMALLKGIWVEISLAKRPLDVASIMQQVLEMLDGTLHSRASRRSLQ